MFRKLRRIGRGFGGGLALAAGLLWLMAWPVSGTDMVLFQADSSEYPIIARAWIVGDSVRWEASGDKTSKLPSESDLVAVETFPQIVELPKPKYPKQARELGIEGTVMVKALIDTSGQVVKVKVAKAPDPDHGLSEAAVEAVKAGKFMPATNGGKPIACWIALPLEFKLDDENNSKAATTE